MSSMPVEQTLNTYAWCFDHGSLHKFVEPEGIWCTAAWVPLDGTTEEQALTQKQLLWGEADFFDQLPLDRQGGIIAMTESRRHNGF